LTIFVTFFGARQKTEKTWGRPLDASTLLSIDPDQFGPELTVEGLCGWVDWTQDTQDENPFKFKLYKYVYLS
jgi:hypothetical protein